MAWPLRTISLLVVLGGLAACAELAGLGDYGTKADGTGGGGLTAAVCAAGCEADEICLPPPPPGWSGPVGLEAGCGGEWSRQLDDGLVDVAAPPAECGCTCGAPTGGQCPSGPVTLYATPDCSDEIGGVTVASCSNGSGFSGNIASDTYAVVGSDLAPDPLGACAPDSSSDVATVTGTPSALCSADEAAEARFADTGCAARRGPAARYCIASQGDRPCPTALGYADRSLLWAGEPVDSRGCTPCSCGAPAGASCTSETKLWAQAGCTSAKKLAAHDGLCHALPFPGFGSISTDVTLDPGVCPAEGGDPMGEASPERAWTVCCTPSDAVP